MSKPSAPLKPCPFCGEAFALASDAFYHFPSKTDYWQMECGACGASGPKADNDEDAVEWWNDRRAPRGTGEQDG